VLTLLSGSASDVGQVRETNEDSVLDTCGLFVVADGMGGHAAGDVASRLAVEHLDRLSARVDDLRPDDLVAALGSANDEILASAAEHEGRAGMGTTVAGLGVVRVGGSDHWIIFNVGDSRVYRFAADTLVLMTVDHSEVEELVAAGRLAPAEARSHPLRNVVTRALGTDPAPSPDLWVFPPTPGERFLICSDGLSLELDDGEIADVLRSEPSAQRTAEVLVRLAVAAGGRDNVTAVVVDLPMSQVVPPVDDRTAPRVPGREGR
jgi:protein phosphatase